MVGIQFLDDDTGANEWSTRTDSTRPVHRTDLNPRVHEPREITTFPTAGNLMIFVIGPNPAYILTPRITSKPNCVTTHRDSSSMLVAVCYTQTDAHSLADELALCKQRC